MARVYRSTAVVAFTAVLATRSGGCSFTCPLVIERREHNFERLQWAERIGVVHREGVFTSFAELHRHLHSQA